jgi:hypothetical protein
MLEVQEKKLKQAIDMLELLGLEFKVIRPDGFEYGKLEVKPPEPPKPEPKKIKKLPKYKRGETRSFFVPIISKMEAGHAEAIYCKGYDARVIARDISSYCVNTFGRESISCVTNREANTVEVLALKNLG